MEENENKDLTTKRVSIVSLLANIFLLIIKMFIGIIFKSQGMIADSLNSAGDIFASLMSYIGSKIAYKPRDIEHPDGHGKAEYIFSELISISMIIASVLMIKDSLKSIIDNQVVVFSVKLILVCVITIIIKFCLYIYAKSKYKINNSILIKSNMIDHRNDIFLTSGTIIGIMFSYFGYHFVDGIVGISISIVIFFTGIKLFMSTYRVLMDTNISKENSNEIIEEVLKFEEVLNIDSLYTKAIGNGYLLILKISMDGKKSLEESHDLGYNIKQDILDKFDYIKQVIVHINPN
jgi:cation diffusion facilitator family transporter